MLHYILNTTLLFQVIRLSYKHVSHPWQFVLSRPWQYIQIQSILKMFGEKDMKQV